MKLFTILALCVACCFAVDTITHPLDQVFLNMDQPQLQKMLLELHNSVEGIPEEFKNILTRLGIYYPGSEATTPAPIPSKFMFKGREKLSMKESEAVDFYLAKYFRQSEHKKKVYVPDIVRPHGQYCRVDDDCPSQQICFSLRDALTKSLKDHDSYRHLSFFVKALAVGDKECSPRMNDFVNENRVTAIASLRSALTKIEAIFTRMHGQKGMEHFLDEVEAKVFKKFDFKASIEDKLDPVTRQAEVLVSGQPQPQYYYPPVPVPAGGGGGGGDNLLLLLALSGGLDGDGGSSLNSILPLLLLSGGGTGGGAFGGDLLSNPFLMITLLSDNSSSLTDILPLLLLSGAGGAGGAGGFTNPLFYFLAFQNNTDDILLPLLLFGGLDGGSGLGSGLLSGGQGGYDGYDDSCSGAGQNPMLLFLMFSSLGGGGGLFNDSMLPLILLLGNQGCPGAGGLGSIELLLLPSILGGNSSLFSGDRSLLLLMIMGGLGTGGSGGLDPSLLLLTMLDDSLNTTDLLPILFLSDPNFRNSELAFLVLFGFLGNDGGGLGSNILPLLLLFSQGSAGLTGSATLSTAPYSVTQTNPNIPPGGGPQGYGGTVSTGSGGLLGLGGGGGGLGIWELLIFSIIGGDDFDILPLLLMSLISQGSFLGGSPDPAPIYPPVNPGPIYPVNPNPIYPVNPNPIYPVNPAPGCVNSFTGLPEDCCYTPGPNSRPIQCPP